MGGSASRAIAVVGRYRYALTMGRPDHPQQIIRHYLLFRFLQDFALIYPVYAIMFRNAGLNYKDIGLLFAIWAGAVMVLEIPSGFLADLWSRRGTVSIALLLKAAGFLLWWMHPTFAGFAAGFVLWGFQEALSSGTTEALLFDPLKAGGQEHEFVRASGLGMLLARIAVGLAMVLGAWVFSRSEAWALGLSVVAMVGAAAVVLRIPDIRLSPDGAGDAETPIGGTLTPRVESPSRRIITTVRSAARVPGLVALVLFGAFGTAVYGVLDEFDALFARFHGVPVAWIGVWGLVRLTGEGVGGWFAPRLARIIRLRAVRRGARSLVDSGVESAGLERGIAGWVAAASLLLAAGTVFGSRVLLPLYFVYYAMMAAAEVLYHAEVQHRIESSGRATVASIVSSVYTAAGMGQILLFGWVADRWSIAMIFPVGAVLSATAAAGYLGWHRARSHASPPA